MPIGERGFWSGFTLGTGTGIGVTALADPKRGRRRRAMVKDRAAHWTHRATGFFQVARIDIAHRLQGMGARARSLVLRPREKEVPDSVLHARVRTSLGRLVAHPHSVHASVRGGLIELDGYVVGTERQRMLRTLRRLPGVKHVDDSMLLDGSPELTPALQGGRATATRRGSFARESWRPATRVAAGMGAVGLIATGRCKGGLAGKAATSAGVILGLRAALNMDLRRMFGLRGRRGIDIKKNLHVAAPPDVVYRFWRNLEVLPSFMPHVKEVRELGDGRSRWTIAGPAGAPLSWTAEITQDVPGQVLAWKSVRGSILRHAGIVKFKRADGGTEVEVQMTYNPPGGVIAHAIAAAFSADPKHDLDRDLLRMKSLIEHGKTTAHGETITRDDLSPTPPLPPT